MVTVMGKPRAILFACLAAVFYAVNVPFSKMLMAQVGPTSMAAFLYLGAGVGIGALSLAQRDRGKHPEPLSRADLPFVIGMIVLDIAAPILLMLGIRAGTSSNAALLGNFEIVATTLIALMVFGEAVGKRLWAAIALIVFASALLSFEGAESFRFTPGSLLVLGAATCWGLENNCTRKISSKDTYEIVVLKGVFSGLGSLAVALAIGEAVPGLPYVAAAMLLGFVAYGLSIFLYVRSQSVLGAAKTSAYYAIAPFVGAFLSFALLGEALSATYVVALAVMVAGTSLVVVDTLVRSHAHEHAHTFVHAHGGSVHEHTIVHSHEHNHYVTDGRHGHRHTRAELERASGHEGGFI